jgi:hypothetical protein
MARPNAGHTAHVVRGTANPQSAKLERAMDGIGFVPAVLVRMRA